MFRRRRKLPLIERLAEMIWPRAGWVRFLKYVWHRLGRLAESPHKIAAGFASGVAISFTPLVGAHVALALLLAAAVRGSLLAAAIGTLVANPWTFPFIWLASYRLGHWLLPEIEGITESRSANFVVVFSNLVRSILTLDTDLFIQRVWPIFLPMMVGGVLLALVAWPLIYWPIKRLIERYKARGHRRVAGRRPSAPST